MLICFYNPQPETNLYTYGASEMCIVPVHAQGFACTKSYCLVIGAQGCEQFAQSHAAIPKPEVKRTTF